MGNSCSSSKTESFVERMIKGPEVTDWNSLLTTDNHFFLEGNPLKPLINFKTAVHITGQGQLTPIVAILFHINKYKIAVPGHPKFQQANKVLGEILRMGITFYKENNKTPIIDLLSSSASGENGGGEGNNARDVVTTSETLAICASGLPSNAEYLKTLLDVVDDDSRLEKRGIYYCLVMDRFLAISSQYANMVRNNDQKAIQQLLNEVLFDPFEALLDHNIGFIHHNNNPSSSQSNNNNVMIGIGSQQQPTSGIVEDTVLHHLFVKNDLPPEIQVQFLQRFISSGKDLKSLAKLHVSYLRMTPLFAAVKHACPECVQELCANASAFGIYGKEQLFDDGTWKNTVFHLAINLRQRNRHRQNEEQHYDEIAQIVQALFSLPGANEVKNYRIRREGKEISPLDFAMRTRHEKLIALMKANGCQ